MARLGESRLVPYCTYEFDDADGDEPDDADGDDAGRVPGEAAAVVAVAAEVGVERVEEESAAPSWSATTSVDALRLAAEEHSLARTAERASMVRWVCAVRRK